MKEIDDIDNLFSSVLGDEKIVPPTAVKSSIDAELFGGALGGRMTWLLLPLILLVIGTGAYFWVGSAANESSIEIASAKLNNDQLESKDALEMNNAGSTRLNNIETNSIIDVEEQSSINSNSNLYDNALSARESKPNSNVSNSKLIQSEDINESETNSKFNAFSNNFTETTLKENQDVNITSENATNASTVNQNESPSAEISTIIDVDDALQANNSSKVMQSESGLKSEVIGENHQSEGRVDSNFDKVNTLNNVDGLITNSTELVSVSPTQSIAPCATIAKPVRKNLFALNIYVGVNQGVDFEKPTTQNYFLKEKIGSQQSIELSYALAPRVEIATGIDYLKFRDVYSNSTTNTVTTLESSYYDYTMAYDTILMDSVAVDSTMINVYSDEDIVSSEDVTVVQTAISLPLYFQYSWNLRPRIKAKLSTGVLLSYWSNRVSGGTTDVALVKRQFGLSMMTRPEISYIGMRMGVGVYGRVGYDFIPLPAWKVANRKRFNVGGGIFLRYQL